MSRSGFLFGMSAPAAILTLLAHPMVRQAADGLTPVAAPISTIQEPVRQLKALEPVAFRTASIQKFERPTATSPTPAVERSANDKGPPKPRKLMREGCEGAISSLAGPEARRMVPGRCIS